VIGLKVRDERFATAPVMRMNEYALNLGVLQAGEPKEIAVFDPDAVEKVLDALPSKEEAGRLADRISGLASASRIEALIALGTAELCVGDVAAVLGLSMSATSTMLKQMRSLDLVAIRHAGKQTYYRLADKRVPAILDFARRSPSEDGT
jgi:ArsR family transcriptional regulator